MNLKYRNAVTAACITLCLLQAAVLTAASIPALRGHVNDTAGMFSPGVRAEMENLLSVHERETTNQVVVATVPSLEGEVLETYSIRLAEAWKIGRKGRDNGVIFLFSKKDRKIRIEVGYGLEGRLTDLVCGRIIRFHIVPYFKAGRFDEGLRSGVQAVLGVIKGEYAAVKTVEPRVAPARNLSYYAKKVLAFAGIGVLVIMVGAVAVLLLVSLFNMGFMHEGVAGWAGFVFISPLFLLMVVAPLLGPAKRSSVPFFSPYFITAVVAGLLLGIRLFLMLSTRGKRFAEKYRMDFSGSSGGGSSGSSSWSSSSSSYSSSGSSSGGYSGGGGSFGGGGASGSW